MAQLILLILNLLDYTLTMINRGNFEEGNPLMQSVLDNTVLLTTIKLIIVPLFIWVLYKNKNLKTAKLGTTVLIAFYLYAVVLGFLYLWRNL